MDFEQQLRTWKDQRDALGHHMSFLSWYRQKQQPNKRSLFTGICLGFCFGLLLSNITATL